MLCFEINFFKGIITRDWVGLLMIKLDRDHVLNIGAKYLFTILKLSLHLTSARAAYAQGLAGEQSFSNTLTSARAAHSQGLAGEQSSSHILTSARAAHSQGLAGEHSSSHIFNVR
jgi:hypothetical protein